jgi:hypothetical protein
MSTVCNDIDVRIVLQMDDVESEIYGLPWERTRLSELKRRWKDDWTIMEATKRELSAFYHFLGIPCR